MRIVLAMVAFGLLAQPAVAQDRAGCDKFNWPVENVRQLFANPPQGAIASGAELPRAASLAGTLALKPLAEAALPQSPERVSANGTFAGFVQMNAPEKAGSYLVTLSDEAWIDVIQDKRYIKPLAFTGTRDCPGIRKSIKVDLASAPVLIQLSGSTASTIKIAITKSD